MLMAGSFLIYGPILDRPDYTSTVVARSFSHNSADGHLPTCSPGLLSWTLYVCACTQAVDVLAQWPPSYISPNAYVYRSGYEHVYR